MQIADGWGWGWEQQQEEEEDLGGKIWDTHGHIPGQWYRVDMCVRVRERSSRERV